MDSGKLSCELAGRCSGCPWWDDSHQNQLSKKQAAMRQMIEALGPVPERFDIQSVGKDHVRSRLDLTLEKQGHSQVLGLYALDRSGIVDMKTCPMAIDELDRLLRYVREYPLPDIKKGSLRLRVSPRGEWGVWIDFSNLDIKNLLEDGEWLAHLKAKCVVEMGQRSKRLALKPEGRWGLFDPELHSWFETYTGFDLDPHPLFLTIAGFSQAGFDANRKLIEVVLEEVRRAESTRVFEFFCGSGNFTLPLLSNGFEVWAVEMEALALQGLDRSLEKAQKLQKFDSWGRLEVRKQDLYRLKDMEMEAPVWVVDPPRSGLKNLLDFMANLEPRKRPRSLIYISCFLESWRQDAQRLIELGYHLKSARAVDQFPQTPHCEWITHFSL